MLIVLIAPLALMVMANNLSSGLIIVGIGFVMMFIACKKKWIFILSMALGAAVFIFAPMIAMGLEKAGILESYQLSRILVWKNPEAYPRDGGYQVLQGLYAIGSGGLLGKGLGQSIQKLSFLPEPQNDMIFAIICEELGLFGAISVILIFLFMIYRFMLIAGNAPDLLGPSGGGSHGPHCHPGDLKHCRGDQCDPQYGHHSAVHQLWRHLGAVPHGGDGHGSQRVQPDKAGEIRIRRNTGPVRCIGYCIACIWGSVCLQYRSRA